ncbi:Protein MtfA [compost metagenome]
MLDGEPDGVPPFSRVLHPDIDAEAWAETFLTEYDRFAEAWEARKESDWEHPERLPPALRIIDPYGGEAPAEFFAVTSEAFFVEPGGLARHWPVVYQSLASFYRQDPAAM